MAESFCVQTTSTPCKNPEMTWIRFSPKHFYHSVMKIHLRFSAEAPMIMNTPHFHVKHKSSESWINIAFRTTMSNLDHISFDHIYPTEVHPSYMIFNKSSGWFQSDALYKRDYLMILIHFYLDDLETRKVSCKHDTADKIFPIGNDQKL